MAEVIQIDIELIAELRSLKAISMTDTEEIRAETVDYAKISKLISAIMRRSNYSYNSFQEVLRKTLQTAAADYLNEGEMPAVHLNNNRPDLDGPLSLAFNDVIRNKKTDDAEINDLVAEMNGFSLNLVKAMPGQSIVIFIYCKTVHNAVKFTQLFNSWRLQYMLESILNRLLLTIEPHNTETLDSRISLEDEEIATLEEFTGIEGWMTESLHIPKLFGKKYSHDATTQTDHPLLSVEERTDLHKEQSALPNIDEVMKSRSLDIREYMGTPYESEKTLPDPPPLRSKPSSMEDTELKSPESSLEISHADAIQKNFNLLLRCTTINLYVIVFLRAKDVLNEAQEHILKMEINPLNQRFLLFKWLKEVSPDKYESFLQVMKDTEQGHVANLLKGSSKDDHLGLPLSDARYTRLAKSQHKLANIMYINNEMIAKLRSSKAISMTDVGEIGAETIDCIKNSKLIGIMMKGSNQSYDSFQEVLRKTLQTAAAEFLNEGEMPAVRGSCNRPDLDELLSHPFKYGIRSRTTDEEGIQDLLAEITGLSLNSVKEKSGQKYSHLQLQKDS